MTTTKITPAIDIKPGDRLYIGGAETLPIERIERPEEWYGGMCLIVHFHVGEGHHLLLDATTWYPVIIETLSDALNNAGIDRKVLDGALRRSRHKIVSD